MLTREKDNYNNIVEMKRCKYWLTPRQSFSLIILLLLFFYFFLEGNVFVENCVGRFFQFVKRAPFFFAFFFFRYRRHTVLLSSETSCLGEEWVVEGMIL